MLRRRIKLLGFIALAALIITLPSCSSTDSVQGLPLYEGAEEKPTPDDLKMVLNISDLSCHSYKVDAKPEDITSWHKNLTGSYVLAKENLFSPPDNPNIKFSMMYYRDNDKGVLIAVLPDPHVADMATLVIAEGPWSKVEVIGTQEGPKGGGEQEPEQPPEKGEMMYQIYPDTDEAPVLELYWGPPDLAMDNIARFTPYGIWEGPYEPANEMRFYTFSSHDPVYSPCAGTVVRIESGIDQATGNRASSITIRYGRNYSVTLHHVVDIPPELKLGAKVEAKTLIGHTQKQMNVGWWEIEVSARVGNVVRSKPPYDFFSPESKKLLDDIIPAARKNESSPYSTWTVVSSDILPDPEHGQGSWIQDFGGATEWWSSGDRLGIKGDPDTLVDFLISNNKESLIPFLTGGPEQTSG